MENDALQRSAGVIRWGSGRGGGDQTGEARSGSDRKGTALTEHRGGGSGGEMIHPPGHSAVQHAGDAKKGERCGGRLVAARLLLCI